MDERFEPVDFDEIGEAVRRHLNALPNRIDSFLEDHILASAHFRITVGGEPAGFASIHQERLITQFALDEPYRRYGQSIFRHLRRMEQVRSAFVPTCDEFFLAHALDDYRQVAKQAYLFAAPRIATTFSAPASISLRLAAADDIDFVRRETGEFFEPIERAITAGELFLTQRHAEPVGFGLMVASRLYEDVASIGMFTIDRFRRTGVGTATIAFLIAECHRRGRHPVAGCWYYNHRSKRTLERAGMFSPTRLLKIDY